MSDSTHCLSWRRWNFQHFWIPETQVAALTYELEQPTLTCGIKFMYSCTNLMKRNNIPFMKLCIHVDESKGNII